MAPRVTNVSGLLNMDESDLLTIEPKFEISFFLFPQNISEM